jgi:hypothetical protein
MTTPPGQSTPPPSAEPPLRSEAEARLILAKLKTLRWKEATGHFVIIVVGVMVALLADAWREERGERRREAAYAADLKRDLTETLRILDNSIVEDSIFVARAAAMHAYLQSTDEAPLDSVLGWRGVGVSGFAVVSGTFRAIFETGDLRLMRDDVRRSLTAFAADLEYAERQIDWLSRDLAETGRLIREREETYRRYLRPRHGPNAGQYTLNVTQMRSDPIVRAAYATALVRTRTHQARLINFRGAVTGLQKVLDTEVARRQ